MNLVDCFITKILRCEKKTEDENCCWEVEVEYDTYGGLSTEVFRFFSKQTAENLKVGDRFQR